MDIRSLIKNCLKANNEQDYDELFKILIEIAVVTEKNPLVMSQIALDPTANESLDGEVFFEALQRLADAPNLNVRKAALYLMVLAFQSNKGLQRRSISIKDKPTFRFENYWVALLPVCVSRNWEISHQRKQVDCCYDLRVGEKTFERVPRSLFRLNETAALDNHRDPTNWFTTPPASVASVESPRPKNIGRSRQNEYLASFVETGREVILLTTNDKAKIVNISVNQPLLLHASVRLFHSRSELCSVFEIDTAVEILCRRCSEVLKLLRTKVRATTLSSIIFNDSGDSTAKHLNSVGLDHFKSIIRNEPIQISHHEITDMQISFMYSRLAHLSGGNSGSDLGEERPSRDDVLKLLGPRARSTGKYVDTPSILDERAPRSLRTHLTEHETRLRLLYIERCKIDVHEILSCQIGSWRMRENVEVSDEEAVELSVAGSKILVWPPWISLLPSPIGIIADMLALPDPREHVVSFLLDEEVIGPPLKTCEHLPSNRWDFDSDIVGDVAYEGDKTRRPSSGWDKDTHPHEDSILEPWSNFALLKWLKTSIAAAKNVSEAAAEAAQATSIADKVQCADICRDGKSSSRGDASSRTYNEFDHLPIDDRICSLKGLRSLFSFLQEIEMITNIQTENAQIVAEANSDAFKAVKSIVSSEDDTASQAMDMASNVEIKYTSASKCKSDTVTAAQLLKCSLFNQWYTPTKRLIIAADNIENQNVSTFGSEGIFVSKSVRNAKGEKSDLYRKSLLTLRNAAKALRKEVRSTKAEETKGGAYRKNGAKVACFRDRVEKLDIERALSATVTWEEIMSLESAQVKAKMALKIAARETTNETDEIAEAEADSAALAELRIGEEEEEEEEELRKLEVPSPTKRRQRFENWRTWTASKVVDSSKPVEEKHTTLPTKLVLFRGMVFMKTAHHGKVRSSHEELQIGDAASTFRSFDITNSAITNAVRCHLGVIVASWAEGYCVTENAVDAVGEKASDREVLVNESLREYAARVLSAVKVDPVLNDIRHEARADPITKNDEVQGSSAVVLDTNPTLNNEMQNCCALNRVSGIDLRTSNGTVQSDRDDEEYGDDDFVGFDDRLDSRRIETSVSRDSSGLTCNHQNPHNFGEDDASVPVQIDISLTSSAAGCFVEFHVHPLKPKQLEVDQEKQEIQPEGSANLIGSLRQCDAEHLTSAVGMRILGSTSQRPLLFTELSSDNADSVRTNMAAGKKYASHLEKCFGPEAIAARAPQKNIKIGRNSEFEKNTSSPSAPIFSTKLQLPFAAESIQDLAFELFPIRPVENKVGKIYDEDILDELYRRMQVRDLFVRSLKKSLNQTQAQALITHFVLPLNVGSFLLRYGKKTLVSESKSTSGEASRRYLSLLDGRLVMKMKPPPKSSIVAAARCRHILVTALRTLRNHTTSKEVCMNERDLRTNHVTSVTAPALRETSFSVVKAAKLAAKRCLQIAVEALKPTSYDDERNQNEKDLALKSVGVKGVRLLVSLKDEQYLTSPLRSLRSRLLSGLKLMKKISFEYCDQPCTEQTLVFHRDFFSVAELLFQDAIEVDLNLNDWPICGTSLLNSNKLAFHVELRQHSADDRAVESPATHRKEIQARDEVVDERRRATEQRREWAHLAVLETELMARLENQKRVYSEDQSRQLTKRQEYLKAGKVSSNRATFPREVRSCSLK